MVAADFITWAKAMDSLMTPGVDMVWVFSGKLRSQERLLEAEITKLKWEFKPVTLVYDPRTMRNMYWVRERGMANDGMSEVLFCCWKGKVPTTFPSHRKHIDAGSPVYYDVIHRVPVATEAELLWGSPGDRERLLAIMGADPVEAADTAAVEEGEGEGQGQDGEEENKRRQYPKRLTGRALVRQPSAEQVPLFPLDNSPRLTKEIVHESGVVQRVFLHGSPAGGAGVYGLLSQRAFVVALVQDDAHGTQMRASLLDRIADSALTPGGSFSTGELKRQVEELAQINWAKTGRKKNKAASSSEAAASSAASAASDSDGGSEGEAPPFRLPAGSAGERPSKRLKTDGEEKDKRPSGKRPSGKPDKKPKDGKQDKKDGKHGKKDGKKSSK